MVRTQIFLVAFSLLVGTTQAIKGGRLRKLEDAPAITVTSALPKKEDKACKDKIVPLKGDPGDQTAVLSEEDSGLEYCETKVEVKKRSKEECDDIKAGKVDKKQKKVKGGFGVRFDGVPVQNPDEFRKSAEKKAKEAGPKAAGCDDVLLLLGGRKLDESEDTLAISAVTFSKIEWTDEECDQAQGCDTLDADVEVFYEGDREADEDEAKEMLTILVEAVASEDYGDAQVGAYWLDLNDSLEIVDGDSISTKGGSRSVVASAAGASVGVAALAAGGFFGLKWLRARQTSTGNGENIAVANFYRK